MIANLREWNIIAYSKFAKMVNDAQQLDSVGVVKRIDIFFPPFSHGYNW